MRISYYIKDKKVSAFSEEAKQKLVESTKNHTSEIITESIKLEASLRSSNTKSEITADIVSQAIRKIKSHPRRRHKALLIFLNILSDILFAIMGNILDIEKIDSGSTNFYFALGVTVTAITMAVILRMKEDK